MTPASQTVLVVEDDAAVRTFLADNLTADGYELLVADCARDAWRLIETKAPDLVVLDVALPDGSGLDLLARVRAADRRLSRADPDLRVLVLSGRASELDRCRGLERGADDYVVKPSSPFSPARLSAVGRRTGTGKRSPESASTAIEVQASSRAFASIRPSVPSTCRVTDSKSRSRAARTASRPSAFLLLPRSQLGGRPASRVRPVLRP